MYDGNDSKPGRCLANARRQGIGGNESRQVPSAEPQKSVRRTRVLAHGRRKIGAMIRPGYFFAASSDTLMYTC